MDLSSIMKFVPLMLIMPMMKGLVGGRSGGGGPMGMIMNLVMMSAMLPMIMGLVGGIA